MKKTAILLSLVFGAIMVKAQTQTKIWPSAVPGETSPKKADKIEKEAALTKVTEVTDPVLDVFAVKTEKGGKPAPAVVIFPGGGYYILALDLEGHEIAKWFNSIGYTAFVLHYRVPQKRDGALQDAQRALRLVRSRAGQYNINPQRTGILGFSAGGSLAARLSSQFAEALYPSQDRADQQSAKPSFSVLVYPAYLDAGPGKSLTPELKIDSAQTPPFFIFQTADDPYGNSALVMAGALRDHKVPVELHFMPRGGHGYGLRKGKDAAEAWPPLLEKWLEKTNTK